MSNKLEILAPAGNREMLGAAVFSGADAVYLGLTGFNARRTAGNFTPDELKEAVSFCHARGVKVHVTLNTLVYDRELPGLADCPRRPLHERIRPVHDECLFRRTQRQPRRLRRPLPPAL